MSIKCRICLLPVSSNYINVHRKLTEEMTVLDSIINCSSITILDNDPLPQSICECCLDKLNFFIEFRLLILKSDIELKHALNNIDKNSVHLEKTKCKSDDKSDINKDLGNPKYKGCKESFKNEQSLNYLNNSFGNNSENSEISCKTDCDYKTNNKVVKEIQEKPSKKTVKENKLKLKKVYECKDCNKTYKKADHYNVHMTKHTGEKKYACEFCPKRFARSYVLVYHRRVHTGERPYTCDICSKSFSSPSNFYTHKKIHTGEKNYKCNLCEESFIQSNSLKIHIRRSHTGERPYLCEICSSAFRSNSSLLTHKLDIHGKKEMCPMCNKLYSSRILKEHVRRHIEKKEGIKRFVCDQCGKKFTCSSSRKKHLLIHSGEKPFSCEICEKSFNQRSALKTHKRVHSDFMPFLCDYCPKSFRYKHHLRSHTNTHHKDLVENDINN